MTKIQKQLLQNVTFKYKMVSSDRVYYWETYADNSLDYISSAFGFTDKETAVKQFYEFIAEINYIKEH